MDLKRGQLFITFADGTTRMYLYDDKDEMFNDISWVHYNGAELGEKLELICFEGERIDFIR